MPQFLPFETCRLRSDRAGLHGKTLAELWKTRDISNSYTTRIDFQDDGTGEIFVTPVEQDWFIKFSLLYGEMLYQFRAALDSCIYDTAILVSGGKNPPPDKETLMFPICSNPGQFKNSARRIAPLPDELKSFVEAVQPYNRMVISNNLGIWKISETLEIIGSWSIIDRHRTLHLVGSFPTRGRIEIIPPPGMTLDDLTFDGTGTLENESKIGTCKIGNFRRDPKVQVKTDLVFEIAVDEGGETILTSMSAPAMLVCVWEILGKFEKHFGIQR
jgi:hypothetical protein